MLRFAPLVLANLTRRKVRSLFTIAAITVAYKEIVGFEPRALDSL